ncbi:MAG: FAD-dependent oxidoreductase [Thermodesulfobacteriota bacterium]
MSGNRIVIVGGVAAGASAAAKARRCSEEAEIILFEKDAEISYATCGMPYYLGGIIDKRRRLIVTDPAFFRKRFRVDVRTGQEVTAIDRAAREVVVRDMASGEVRRQGYDQLILATGAKPVIPPVPGVDRPFVFFLKTLADTDRLHAFLQAARPRTAVLIGAGLIGMETAENLAGLGVEVAMVDFLPQVLGFLDQDMAIPVQGHLAAKGVRLFLGERVAAIDEEDGRGLVVTAAGRRLPADLVLLGVGVRPNVDLAREAGLAIGAKGGIVVDAEMRTADPHILAAGDCIETVQLVTGSPMFFPMGSAANKQGRAAGANACGRHIQVPGFVGTVIVKVFDLTVAKTGLSEREAAAEGFSPQVTHILADDHAGYYPGAKEIHLKIIADAASGRLLGAQAIGEAGVDKRIDVLACALYNRMQAADLIHLDLAYAPPYSSARDPLVVAGALSQNLAAGDWQPVTAPELETRLGAGEDLVLVDLRTRGELLRTGVIPGARHLPVDELRDRMAELDPGRAIVLYCAVGLRSYLANRILALAGYPRVQTLTGGFAAWTADRHPFAG